MSEKRVVNFWFDSICPFAWITSRWIREVEKVRDIEVHWNIMSLAVLNEGRDLDPGYREHIDKAWFPARAATQVWDRFGDEKLGDYYTAVGTEIHNNGVDDYEKAVSTALNAIGVSDEEAQEIITAAGTDVLDEKLRESHQKGISLVGDDVGTPVVAIGDTAFFGPVLTRIPRGEEAGTIFDGAAALAEYPYFYELKRSRTTTPEFD